ncbi:hypothetical protein BHE74_00020369 [Ensete ventricosum]|nr:hypothetical protein GW17_00012748 [Ensete ventricosum]RWW71851.1 hypothetical protein BHE74_00020369 [Ensete ventricosum]
MGGDSDVGYAGSVRGRTVFHSLPVTGDLDPALWRSILLEDGGVWPSDPRSEILEYRKSSSLMKVHSDVNLDGLDNEAVREDDRDALLEGGLSRPSSARLHNSSVRANLIRLVED